MLLKFFISDYINQSSELLKENVEETVMTKTICDP